MAAGIMNDTFTGGTGTLSAWDVILQNTSVVQHLVVDRMQSDFMTLAPQLRKAYSTKDLDTSLCKLLKGVLD